MAESQEPIGKRNDDPIVVFVQKKNRHTAHRGGAWKVAYADFVTAMMALFIVLWLMNTNPDVQKATGAYFRDPTGHGKQVGSGLAGIGDDLVLKKDDMHKLQETLAQALKQMPDFQKLKDQVQMTVTGEGLRVELLETAKGMFFENGSAHPSEKGKELLVVLAHELGSLPNSIMIEGHTDAKPFSNGGAYTNWELSSDRANSARRLMEDSGLRPNQVTQVRGFADQRLRKPDTPDDPSNRRISVIVQYMSPPSAGESSKEIANNLAPPAVREKR
ncbi:MAG TPA: flagellar motor protein MotB [Bryobacteraceae bacterium]|nr:flagellar motor protein MotB [Bryobacteraceae bacterium]